ncbi:AAC(3) family N-acetyltransferase [Pseudoalteromonas sp. DL2-H2.2]|uniref:AAC(3) family N-acetyltransferase n=1 Tax=Pseudoalteromonas sp. DL2-H2.2 TaxID=2908889 RepID=UPI001F41EF33|nr:AAC(3) family N-acetyltransferase [Pseudoalteromonas sp. DL2-H2.2]MCF2909710.1 AAC(3) family N-acetyltransferase [Pseudoalteromonas sp. DL2-H2.2]
MKTITKEQITGVLEQLELHKSNSVFIHSSLFTLGKIESVKVAYLPNVLLSCFQNVLGKSGGVFMPSFNYDFPKVRNADLNTQRSVLGFWPEWFRTQPNVVRSGHPMFSICGLGPDADAICKPSKPEFFAFGPDSTFSRLIEQDCTLVLQGIGLRVATVIVQIEHMLGLKYRFNKPFKGTVTLTNGKIYEGEYYHYCFPINNAYREDYSGLESALLSAGVLKKASLGRSFIMSVNMKALYQFVERFTKDTPFALLNCNPEQLYRFEDGKEVAYPAEI